MTIREAIKHLESYQDKDQGCAFDLWLRDDVRLQFGDMSVTTNEPQKLTDEQCDQVLEKVEHYKDATIGINWDVIQCAIDECNFDADEMDTLYDTNGESLGEPLTDAERNA